jgi:hypothetical protein
VQSSVLRVEKCIGGWGSESYENIKSLVKSQGTGKESILYKNFKALKAAIPVIEAINNDDEHAYDAETAADFHVMLYDLGYKTTVAPYTNRSFWQNFVAKVNAARPGAVDRIDLQCYEGGAGNKADPDAWKMGNIAMHAGLLHFNSSSEIKSQMTTWKNNSAVAGGFLWVYNASDFNLQNHAKAITDVFGGGEVVYQDKMRPHTTVFAAKNFQGEGVCFEIGRFSTYSIASQNFKTADLSSVKVHEGFAMRLYENDKPTGKSVLLEHDAADMDLVDISAGSSWSVSTNGDKSLAGKTCYIKNRQSGMYLSLEEENTRDGIALLQKEFSGENSQKWKFNHLQNGNYNITNLYSGKTIQLREASDAEGGVAEQGAYAQKSHQRNVVVKDSDKDVYKIISEHSTKYLAIEPEKEPLSGAKIIQTENAVNESIYWTFEDTSLGIAGQEINAPAVVFPNPAEDKLHINGEIKGITQVIAGDTQGRRIFIRKVDNNTLDVSDLPHGMYFLQIFAEGTGTTIISRFIKR